MSRRDREAKRFSTQLDRQGPAPPDEGRQRVRAVPLPLWVFTGRERTALTELYVRQQSNGGGLSRPLRPRGLAAPFAAFRLTSEVSVDRYIASLLSHRPV